MPTSRDYDSRSSFSFSINPTAISTNTTLNGTGVDVSTSAAVNVIFMTGSVTDGTYTPTVMESDDDSTYTAVADANLVTAETAITASYNITQIGVHTYSKYIRARIASTSVTTGVDFFTAAIETFTS